MATTGTVILNPQAGSCDDVDAWRRRLAAAGFAVRVPGSAEEARELARSAAREGTGTVIAAGGDGTVHHVANGLLGEARPVPRLGILPLGTANDYARSLDLPDDPGEALELLASGTPARPVDVIAITHEAAGRSEGGSGIEFCLNVAVGGFGGEATRELDQEEKRHWGSLAYLKSALEELAQLPSFEARVQIDGEERRDTLLNVVVANGRYTGGGVPVAPGARLDDGRLRLLLVPALELSELVRLASRFLAGEADERLVVLDDVRSVAVASDPGMHFRADGEPVGASPVEMEVRPGGLEVIRPASGRGHTDG